MTGCHKKKPGRAKKFKQKSRALCRYLCMQSFSQIYFAIPEKTLRKRRPFSTGFIHPELDWMYRIISKWNKTHQMETGLRNCLKIKCFLRSETKVISPSTAITITISRFYIEYRIRYRIRYRVNIWSRLVDIMGVFQFGTFYSVHR